MPLPSIHGHEHLLSRLEAAIASGRFPQAALFAGPAGAGKQRLALWVAQSVLCEAGTGTPCGACQACHQVLGLAHPDLHWFVPIPRPKATDPAKQVDEARELLAEVMAARRKDPIYRPPDGLVSHSLASVRLLQRIVAVTPFQARRKVVILGDAERLVVQEASQEAANALLKVLEEPPGDTVLLLTAAEPQALLPTIRSRVVPIRVGPVGDDAVRAFLTHELDPPLKGAALTRRVELAEGLIGRAVWIDDKGAGNADRYAERLLTAAAEGAGSWAELALAQAPWGARGDFAAMLDALAVRLRRRLADEAATGETAAAARHLDALRRVEETRATVGTNANPQLALAVLAQELERLA